MGPAPGIEFYYDQSIKPYKGWFDFRAQLSNYLSRDCQVLLEILITFNYIFLNKFKISFIGVPT
jgi:hypothetical protein